MAAGREMLAEEASIGALLKFIGSGANGPIMRALGECPMRTKKLTERVPSYTPRSVYRQAHKLHRLELLTREETSGVPSSVVNSLSAPRGRELFHLLDSHAAAVIPPHSALPAHDGSWTPLGLLGETWAAGWIDALSRQSQSTTDLAEVTSNLTFHQVSRRTQQLSSWNLVYSAIARGQAKRFHLTDQARQGVRLVAGVGRWRKRYVRGVKEALTVGEMTTVLRTCLPLLLLPGDESGCIKFGVVGTAGSSETLTVAIGMGGRVRSAKEQGGADSWALGTVDTWLETILDGNRDGLRTGGDRGPIDRCLSALDVALSSPRPVTLPA